MLPQNFTRSLEVLIRIACKLPSEVDACLLYQSFEFCTNAVPGAGHDFRVIWRQADAAFAHVLSQVID